LCERFGLSKFCFEYWAGEKKLSDEEESKGEDNEQEDYIPNKKPRFNN